MASRARLALASVFFAYGIIVGTWAPHIPLAKERLAASPGFLGLALLCFSFGAILAMPPAGGAVARHGSAPMAVLSTALAALALPGPFLAPNLALFALALLIIGAALGALDVAMNAQALIVERALKRPVISLLHGIYSAAGLAGAGLSAVLIGRLDEPTRALVTTLACLAIAVASRRHLIAEPTPARSGPMLVLPSRATIGLGILCFLALLIEGTTIDWAAVHLRENRGASGNLASLAFGLYSGGMALSRFVGDRFRTRLGSPTLLRWCGGLTAAATLAAIASPSPALALAAFALAGLAIGPIAPVLFAGGGRAEPENPGHGIAAVSTLGYTGLLMGPALVGLLAEAMGLAMALAIVAATAVVIALGAARAAVADDDAP